MRNQEIERPIFTNLLYDVRNKLNISWPEYVLIDMISVLSQKHGYCYKTTSSIAYDMGMSFNGIKKLLARLEDRELIIRHQHGFKPSSAYLDIANTIKPVKTIETAQSSQIALSATNRGGKLHKVQSIAQSSDKIHSIDKKINKKDLELTFNKILEALDRKGKYTSDYEKKLKLALSDFTEAELLQAATYFKQCFAGNGSTWHTENRKYYTAAQFFGKDKHNTHRYQNYYEQALEKSEQPQKAKPIANPNLAKFFPEFHK